MLKNIIPKRAGWKIEITNGSITSRMPHKRAERCEHEPCLYAMMGKTHIHATTSSHLPLIIIEPKEEPSDKVLKRKVNEKEEEEEAKDEHKSCKRLKT